MQMRAGGVAGGAGDAQHRALGHHLPLGDLDSAHVGVQRGIAVAVVILAVVDLNIIAPAVVVGGCGDYAAADGVDFGAARRGIVGAAVSIAAKVAGNILIGGKRAAKIQRSLY